jgi:predicted nucleotide-binding protein
MAAQRAANLSQPKPAVLTNSQKQDAIARLRKRLTEVRELDVDMVTGMSDPDVIALGQALDRTLVHIFGADTVEYKRYSGFRHLGAYALDDPTYVKYVRQNKPKTIAVLEGIIAGFQEDLDEFQSEPNGSANGTVSTEVARNFSKVFIVHGHDEGARASVDGFIRKLGFKPIVLNEQSSRGMTVIEKIEAHGDVPFAVVLLTPDDEGCKKGGTPAPRARQNVILELGYFISRLGRNNVCALKRGNLELPSDFLGVVTEPFDDAGHWQRKLATELEDAGFMVDWKTAMRP